MTTPPISYDKNQSLDQQGHLLAGIRFPNQLQLAHVKSQSLILSHAFDSRKAYLFDTIRSQCSISFEPKVSKLPSARNNRVSSTFLTAESFSR